MFSVTRPSLVGSISSARRHTLPQPCPVIPRRRRVTHMSSAGAQLRSRIAAVKSAEKIVSALRLVAAARIRASSHAALRSRPFAKELQNTLAQLIRHIVKRRIDVTSLAQSAPPFSLAEMHGPFLADPMVQRALIDRMYLVVMLPSSYRLPPPQVTLLTVVAADRKFCGSYNKDVISRAVIRLRQLEAAGSRVELVAVGQIAVRFFSRNFSHLTMRMNMPMSHAAEMERSATRLSHGLLSEFIAGGVERVEVVYTRYISLIATAPSVRTLFPLTPTGLETVGDELFELTITSRNGRIVPKRVESSRQSDLHDLKNESTQQSHNVQHVFPFYTMSDEEAILLLNSMLPMFVTSQLLRILREALASEQVRRLAAMTAASENAQDLVERLQTQYNRERQARITTEIIEVARSTNQ